METIADRFKAVAKHNKLSVTDFEREVGLANGVVGKMKNPTITTFLKVVNRFPEVNLEWLISGKGTMLGMPVSLAEATKSKQSQGIPFLDGEHVAAGMPCGEAEPLSKVGYINMPTLEVRQGDFAVRAKGRSMIDTQHPEFSIPDGSIVVVSPWTESWMEWGEIYCIATRSGYVIKRIQPSEDDLYIRCVSANTEEGYAPYDIPKADVLNITRVRAVITLKRL